MNRVELIGRLTKDPDVRYTQGENPTAVARYILAIDRRGKEKRTDFIPCIVFGKGAEFAEKYMKKGSKFAVTGRIQSGSFEKDGKTVYTVDVFVEEQEFCEKKSDGFESLNGELPWE